MEKWLNMFFKYGQTWSKKLDQHVETCQNMDKHDKHALQMQLNMTYSWLYMVGDHVQATIHHV